MIWFKHMTNMRHDPKVQNLVKWFGLEGYARWLLILEIIASEMDQTDKCSVTLDETIWRNELKIYRSTSLRHYLESCRNLGLISFQSSPNLHGISGESITIVCPKLLEIRARKQPIGSKTRHTDIEVEVEKDNTTCSSRNSRGSPKGKKPSKKKGELSKKYYPSFMKFWELYPRQLDHRIAYTYWLKLKPDSTLIEKIMSGLKTHIDTVWVDKKLEHIPSPVKWLNGRRWEDVQTIAKPKPTKYRNPKANKETEEPW